jgi:K+ transporter
VRGWRGRGIVQHPSVLLALNPAYGIAVSLTMLMTTGLLFVAMREVWRWSLASSAVIALCFLVIVATFLFANLIKVLEGGYIPLLMAAAICTVMLIWHRGVKAVSASVGEKGVSVDAFFALLQQKTVPWVAGSAVFLTRTQNNIPPVMRWYVGHETIVAGEGEAGMAAWQRYIFAFMKRNCTHVINHYHLPSDRVVEISRRVAV